MEKIPYRRLQSMSFGIYRPQEIKNLSVLEITNPNAFDLLEHPTKGGLYDHRLGPSQQEETCDTCGLRSMHCPGHVGHIILPLPVFNPVFIKTLYQLLQGTCMKCHQLRVPKNALNLLLYQFQVLKYGLVGVVQELAEAVSDVSIISSDNKTPTDVSLAVEEKLKSVVESAIAGLDLEECKATARVKSVVECRQKLSKEFIKTYLTNAKQKCPHCNAKNAKIALRHNSRFILNAGKRDVIKPRNYANQENPDDTVENDEPVEEGETSSNTDISPNDAKKHLNLVWKKEKVILRHLFGILDSSNGSDDMAIDMFFIEVLMVPPSRFRPISVVKGRKYLNPQSTLLKDVLTDCMLLKNLIRVMSNEEIPDVDKDQVNKLPGKTNNEKFTNLRHQLQLHVNYVYDSDMDKLNKEKTSCGVKQILEKKEGLFRKHMMGKRVNFAARSVISPDPYIMVDEIGVPTVFAKKLTYPAPVTDWNFEKLRMAVLNGPDVHPGADKVEYGDGRVIKLSATDPIQRQALACQLLTPAANAKGVNKGIPKKVHRHLENGDVLLLNRQPTLHKPSIMAHRVRVLPGEKTLRLHYANCKSYNADFDGDEMNAHFPQSEHARSEAYNIVSVNHQYLVPKDGTPLSGLIQDHIIAGTLLTMRGRFFNREDYQQLVYGAIEFLNKPVKTLLPAILKPSMLWSGKQVVSTVIINIIPDGKPPPTVEGKAKVSVKNWQNACPRKWKAGGTPLKDDDMSESQVIIHSGELLCGVIDKAHIGPTPYGLVHCCYELYGGETSSALLTSLARLFTHYLQIHSGFTLGIEDILLTDNATKKRRKVMHKAKKKGDSVVAKAFDVEDSTNKNEIIEKFREAHLSRDDTGRKMLDFEMKKVTDECNNEINGICMPEGLLKKFPHNNLQLMVQSGAKGSTVNAMQISCALGQIELEGRRVPLMLNGSTLPSFLPYDTSPRAGGFVDGRFLTGIRPQEFFFHCMAGREGLVDTAVKTSRSGYLQRCLIKHLEGIVVNYDMTVRDSDGSVIQFLYGEDGLDISKMQMLKEGKLDLLVKNYAAVINKDEIESIRTHLDPLPPSTDSKEKKERKKKRQKLYHSESQNAEGDGVVFAEVHHFKRRDSDAEASVSVHDVLQSHSNLQDKFITPKKRTPDPVNSIYRPDLTFGSVSEKLHDMIETYVQENYKNRAKNRNQNREKRVKKSQFREMCNYRALKALVQPGEAVGLLAAQSVGEPSTQMTLNTFHFAGRGEMNVTLGIPRLREILMVASASIATPTMDLPLLRKHKVEKEADKLRVKLSTVYLKQVLESIKIEEVLYVGSKTQRFRRYTVRMKFLPYNIYKGVLYTSPSHILTYVENMFIQRIIFITKKKLDAISATRLLRTSHKNKRPGTSVEVENLESPPPALGIDLDEGETSEEGEDDGDTVSAKTRARHDQDREYEEPESDENPDEPDIEDEMEFDSTKTKEETVSEHGTDEEEEKEVLEPIQSEQKTARINRVMSYYELVSDYNYDAKEELWCEFTLQLSLKGSKIDIKTLIEDEANGAVLYQVPNIKKAFLVKNPSSPNSEKMLKTDGVNFLEIFKHVNIIDANKIYSNDIHAIAKIYGIEAASRVLVKEITNVFATYGIVVDPRHLLLIADYMTLDGTYKPCSRIGMESNASPLQQMTFETTMNFLQSAILTGSEDQLKSPSSRLVVGRPVGVGTGCFDVRLKPDSIVPSKKKKS